MDRVSPPTAGDWARMLVDLNRACWVAPWVVASKYCETVSANLAGRTQTSDGVPIGQLFNPVEWGKLIGAWQIDAIAGAGLQSSLHKARPDQIEHYRRELLEAAAVFEERGWGDPSSFHETPPPAPKDALRGDKLVFASGYQPKPGLPGGEDYLAMTRLHTVEAKVLRHDDRREHPWIIFLHGFGMGNDNDLEIAGATKLHRQGYHVVTVPYPFHGNRRVGMPGEGALGLDIMTMLNAQAQGLWDVRRVMGWIRENHPGQRIGAYGASMGGFALGLLAGLEPLDCGIGVIPAFDIIGTFEAAVRDRLGAAYADAARTVLRPLDISALPPKVAPEKLAVIAGIADGITCPDQAVKLQRHFNSSIDWVTAGHLTAFNAVQPRVAAIFREHLYDGTRPAPRTRRLI